MQSAFYFLTLITQEPFLSDSFSSNKLLSFSSRIALLTVASDLFIAPAIFIRVILGPFKIGSIILVALSLGFT